MKINKKYIFLVFWILLIVFLKKENLITFDLNQIEEYIKAKEDYMMALFILLWVIRVFIFIPGVTFMILGGIIFSPIEGILLSTIGLFLSETLVYFISKLLLGSKLNSMINKKYPEIKPLIETYNYKFLALGMIFPLAPSDAICFLSASSGIPYLKYIVTVIVANIPIVIIYSFIGLQFTESIYSILISITVIGIISIYILKIWNKLKGSIR